MIYGTVLCLGDSLTYGARAEGRGYPERLPFHMELSDPRTEWATLNRGVCRETTWQILQRTPAAVRELAGMSGSKVAVLCAGTNDSKYPCTDLDVWESHYLAIIHWFRRYRIPFALCMLPEVDGASMPAFDSDVSNEWIDDANARIAARADSFAVHLVDLSDIGGDLLIDGVHLTAEGYDLMASRIAEVLCG